MDAALAAISLHNLVNQEGTLLQVALAGRRCVGDNISNRLWCRDAEGNMAGAWDAEWVHVYSQYEEHRRRMDEQENAEFFSGSSRTGSARDPLGYYQLMGLEPGCSKQEIQVRPAPFCCSQLLSVLLQISCLLLSQLNVASKIGADMQPEGSTPLAVT